jgi:hypothetical protein
MRRVLLLVLLASFAVPVAAQNCDTALEDAAEQYRAGYFDEAIDRLNDCLEQNAFGAEERRRAYRLLGLSYIGKDREQDARAAVRALLEVAPDYRPDPALDPPPFVALVEEMYQGELPPPTQPNTANLPPPVSITEGFMGALRAQGTRYSDEDGDLGGAGGDLTLGYGFTPQLAVVLRLAGSALEDGPSGESISAGRVGIGGRYHIGGSRSKLVPYLGAAVAYQSLTVEFMGVSADASGPGGEIEGGVLYFFSPSWAINGGVTALFSSLSNEDLDVDSFSATTLNFGLGLSWSPRQNPR